MGGKEIHIVSLNRQFGKPEEFLSALGYEIAAMKGKKTIFLLPEAALGSKPITRQEGKSLANQMSNALARHGQAFAAYSVYEKRTGKIGGKENPLITNTGYLISPKKGKKRGYKAYQKVATFNRGKNLTLGENHVLMEHSPDSEAAREKLFRLAGRVKQFPRLNIGGTIVEMRVCADAAHAPNMDMHPAKQRKEKAHIILVPADGMEMNRADFAHFSGKLFNNGIVVLHDRQDCLNAVRKKGKKIRMLNNINTERRIGRIRLLPR
jgi:hypothetical protein